MSIRKLCSVRRHGAAALAAILITPAAVHAEAPSSPFYVGVSAAPAEFRIDDFHPANDATMVYVPTYKMPGLMVTGGYRASEYLALEARAATFSGTTRDWLYEGNNDVELTIPVHVRIDAAVGVFAKIMLPMARDRVNLYGLLGHMRVRIRERTPIEETQSLTLSGWDGSSAYGAGIEVQAAPAWAIQVERTQLYQRHTESLTTTQLGVLYRF